MSTAERIEFDDVPPADIREVWVEWLGRHGVDPCDVVLPGWIERRADAYQLAYLSFERDERGRPAFDRERREFVTTVGVFQMEGSPLPFPEAADFAYRRGAAP